MASSTCGDGPRRRVGHLLSAYYSRTDSQSSSSSAASDPRIRSSPEEMRSDESDTENGTTIEKGFAAADRIDGTNGSMASIRASLNSSQQAVTKEIKLLNEKMEGAVYRDYRLLVETCAPATGLLSTAKVAAYRDRVKAIDTAVAGINKICNKLEKGELSSDKMRRINQLSVARDLVTTISDLIKLDKTITAAIDYVSLWPDIVVSYKSAIKAVEEIPVLRSSPAVTMAMAKSAEAMERIKLRIQTEIIEGHPPQGSRVDEERSESSSVGYDSICGALDDAEYRAVVDHRCRMADLLIQLDPSIEAKKHPARLLTQGVIEPLTSELHQIFQDVLSVDPLKQDTNEMRARRSAIMRSLCRRVCGDLLPHVRATIETLNEAELFDCVAVDFSPLWKDILELMFSKAIANTDGIPPIAAAPLVEAFNDLKSCFGGISEQLNDSIRMDLEEQIQSFASRTSSYLVGQYFDYCYTSEIEKSAIPDLLAYPPSTASAWVKRTMLAENHLMLALAEAITDCQTLSIIGNVNMTVSAVVSQLEAILSRVCTVLSDDAGPATLGVVKVIRQLQLKGIKKLFDVCADSFGIEIKSAHLALNKLELMFHQTAQNMLCDYLVLITTRVCDPLTKYYNSIDWSNVGIPKSFEISPPLMSCMVDLLSFMQLYLTMLSPNSPSVTSLLNSNEKVSAVRIFAFDFGNEVERAVAKDADDANSDRAFIDARLSPSGFIFSPSSVALLCLNTLVRQLRAILKCQSISGSGFGTVHLDCLFLYQTLCCFFEVSDPIRPNSVARTLLLDLLLDLVPSCCAEPMTFATAICDKALFAASQHVATTVTATSNNRIVTTHVLHGAV